MEKGKVILFVLFNFCGFLVVCKVWFCKVVIFRVLYIGGKVLWSIFLVGFCKISCFFVVFFLRFEIFFGMVDNLWFCLIDVWELLMLLIGEKDLKSECELISCFLFNLCWCMIDCKVFFCVWFVIVVWVFFLLVVGIFDMVDLGIGVLCFCVVLCDVFLLEYFMFDWWNIWKVVLFVCKMWFGILM